MSWEDEVRLKVIDTQTGKRFDVSPKAFKELYIDHGSRIQLDGTEGANADYAWVGAKARNPQRFTAEGPTSRGSVNPQRFTTEGPTSRGSVNPQRFIAEGPTSRGSVNPQRFIAEGPTSRGSVNPQRFTAEGPTSRGSVNPQRFTAEGPTSRGSVNPQIAAHMMKKPQRFSRDDSWQYNDNAFGPDTNAILNKPYNPLPQTEQTQNYTPWQSFWDIGSSAKDALSEGYNLFRDNVQDYRQDRSFSPQNFFSDTFQGISDAYNEPYTPIEALTYDSMADTASGIWGDFTGWLSGDDEIKAAEAEKAELDKYLKDAEYRYVNIHGVAWDEAAIKEVIAQFHRDKRLGKL